MSLHFLPRRTAIVAMLSLVGVLTACGGGSDDGTAPVGTMSAQSVTTAAATETAEKAAKTTQTSTKTTKKISLRAQKAAIAAAMVDGGGTAATSGSAVQMLSAGDYEEVPVLPVTPKIALVDYSAVNTLARKVRLTAYNLAILSIDTRQSTTNLSSLVSWLKTNSPDTKIAYYSIPSEVRDDVPAEAAALTANNWWLRDAGGARVQWTSAYNAYEVNMTDWAPANASGQRWPQWKGSFDANRVFKAIPQIDYVFTDTVMYQGVTADWKRNGTNQTSADTAVQLASRLGYMSYWNTLRSLSPTTKVIGNIHTDLLASPEIKGKLEGAFLEGQIGKSYSYETWGGWTKMMQVYRAAMANTVAPKTVVFHMYVNSATDYAQVRYGIASTLLDDGLFAVNAVDLSQVLPYYDEFSAPLGAAVDAPPTAPTASGIWTRKYANGIVLVNPSATTAATINVGSGYRRLAGDLDTAVNNGAPQGSLVTLGPKQGLVLIKQ